MAEILVCDDDRDIVEAIERNLSDTGGTSYSEGI